MSSFYSKTRLKTARKEASIFVTLPITIRLFFQFPFVVLHVDTFLSCILLLLVLLMKLKFKQTIARDRGTIMYLTNTFVNLLYFAFKSWNFMPLYSTAKTRIDTRRVPILLVCYSNICNKLKLSVQLESMLASSIFPPTLRALTVVLRVHPLPMLYGVFSKLTPVVVGNVVRSADGLSGRWTVQAVANAHG